MKFILLASLLLVCTTIVSGQAEYVEIDNPVYYFLERMENNHNISDYNSFEIPKTREEIANYLSQINERRNLLSSIDAGMLEDFYTEFNVELGGGNGSSTRIINNNGYNFFSEDQKYLYFTTEGDFNLFINLAAEYEYIHNYKKNTFNNNASTGVVGGIIRGTVNNKFGFFLKGTNGNIFGNRETALSRRIIEQNFKIADKPDETFYDYTEGYITSDFDLIKFRLGRDKLNLGYGDLSLIDDYAPVFDFLGLSLKHKFFTYSYIHAKLIDMVPGRGYSDKFLVYHRIGFNINRHLDFGAGELVLYGERGIDLSYLNPFAFYKSVEHSNRDRDNTLLFFDINNNSIPGIKLHFMLLMDDMSYSKIGTGWYGNKVMINSGILNNDLLGLPLDISLNYRRTEPYTFTHRFDQNSFTNMDYPLGTYAIPNSDVIQAKINYRFNKRLEISTSLTYIRHGRNMTTDGKTINYGGDINLGHRETDSESVKFLDGIRSYYRTMNLLLFYEPVNQIKLIIQLEYLNNSFEEQSHKEIQSFLTLRTIF